MVTTGNAMMFIPTAIMPISSGVTGNGNQQAFSNFQNQGLGQQVGSPGATISQMALMANNMALTGSLLTQFSSTLQGFTQGLGGSQQQPLGPQIGYPCPQPQMTPSCGSPQQQQSIIGYLPVYGAPQQQPQQPAMNHPQAHCPPQQQPPQQQPPQNYLPGYGYPPQQQPAPYNPPAYVIPPYTMKPAPTPVPAPTPAYNGGNDARYWGDPHLVGFDGEQYDVMGKGGNIYNMLSDKGVQYNTKFIDWGKPGADGVQPTVIGEAGIQVGDYEVFFDLSGKPPTVDGKPLAKDQKLELGDGRFANWDGQKLLVNTGEYTIDLVIKEKDNHGGYLDSNVKINEGVNPLADGVAAHGLLGQTADGVKGARKGVDGNKNIEKQGGSVIDGVVDDYQVKTLWDNDFKYNRFAPEEKDSLSQLLTLLNGLIAELAA